MEIPKQIKSEIKKMVQEFNKNELDLINDFYKYVVEFKGEEIFLKTKKYNRILPAGRLTYKGDINNMEFAIFKYSSNEYDADEFFFPGAQYLDGTVKGALFACNEAYPPM